MTKKFWMLALPLAVLVTMGASVGTKDRWEKTEFSHWRNRPHEPFGDGEKIFQQVKKELLKNYVDKGLTEDDLYRAAIQGMLSNIDPDKAAWNRLMTPTEYAEMKSDTEGKIVGVGLEISFNEATGHAEVLGTIPGTPSEKAGILRGDQILKIDSKSFKGQQLRDMVYAIRGKSGSEIELTILRDEVVKEFRLTREALTWNPVDSQMLGDGLALVSLHYFNDNTPSALKQALAGLKKDGARGLILDLRGNEGGKLDRAFESIKLLLPKGKPIVTIVSRGLKKEVVVNDGDPAIAGVPFIVLINNGTKSAAEIMAGALKMSGGASLVGTHSCGKWSAQRVEQLPNKFAMKYTTSTFLTVDGQDLSGKGLTPDVVVEQEDAVTQRAQSQTDLKQRLLDDVQLQTAINIFNMRN